MRAAGGSQGGGSCSVFPIAPGTHIPDSSPATSPLPPIPKEGEFPLASSQASCELVLPEGKDRVPPITADNELISDSSPEDQVIDFSEDHVTPAVPFRFSSKKGSAHNTVLVEVIENMPDLPTHREVSPLDQRDTQSEVATPRSRERPAKRRGSASHRKSSPLKLPDRISSSLKHPVGPKKKPEFSDHNDRTRLNSRRNTIQEPRRSQRDLSRKHSLHTSIPNLVPSPNPNLTLNSSTCNGYSQKSPPETNSSNDNHLRPPNLSSIPNLPRITSFTALARRKTVMRNLIGKKQDIFCVVRNLQNSRTSKAGMIQIV